MPITVKQKYDLVSNKETTKTDVDGRETWNCCQMQQIKQSIFRSNIIICLLMAVLVSVLLVTLNGLNAKYQDEESRSENEAVELLHNISFGGKNKLKVSLSPLIIVTDGGCSGSTAVGHYLRELVEAHGMELMEDVHFEFLHTNKNLRTNRWKNPFYHNISVKTAASNYNLTKEQKMIMSIKQVHKVANEQNKAVIFKANIKQYQIYHNHLKKLHPTYFGVYQRDALRRCICMVKDCFRGVIHDGYPIFAENGTQTDLCFKRRSQHEVPIQVVLTNATHCLEVTREENSFLKNQSFPSLPKEELLLFEYSNNQSDLMRSVKSWAHILKSNLKGLGIDVSEAKIQQALEPYQNSFPQRPKYFKTVIRNYDEIEKSLMELGALDF